MAATTTRVRDFTTAEPRLAVEVAAGDAFEALLSLYALGGDEEEADFEIGSGWFEEVRGRAPAGLLERLAEIGDWSVWMALIAEVSRLGAPYSMERLLEHLVGSDPVALRRSLIGVGVCQVEDRIPEEALDAAAAGEAEAVAGADGWCAKCPGLLRLLRMPPAESRDVLVGLLGEFWEEAAPVPEGTVAVLERDADHKRSLARRMDPEGLVEKATNGIAPGPGVEEVILVPSVIIRPWVLIVERNGTRIFCYSVAEENLGGDPDAPPSWLVQFYKALGDERRLSILRRLAEGPASLGELVEHLDLAKSTVHHHVRQLRTAGLVRVTVGEDREYSLRTGAVPEAARLLEGFLGMDPQIG